MILQFFNEPLFYNDDLVKYRKRETTLATYYRTLSDRLDYFIDSVSFKLLPMSYRTSSSSVWCLETQHGILLFENLYGNIRFLNDEKKIINCEDLTSGIKLYNIKHQTSEVYSFQRLKNFNNKNYLKNYGFYLPEDRGTIINGLHIQN